MNWIGSHIQGCHCCKLQDEPFALCGQIGAACVDLRNRVFSTHLIGFLLRATKKEWKLALKRLRYYVSTEALFPASKGKYTAAGGDVQVPTSDESRNKEIDTRIGKANAVLCELYCSAVTKRGFQRTQRIQFLNWSLFRSSPILGDDWKNTVKRINVRYGIFAKSSLCDASWQRAQVWNP